MQFRTLNRKFLALGLGLLLVGASAAKADSITVSNDNAFDGNTASVQKVTDISSAFVGDYEFAYDISFSGSVNISSGDGFLIADFGTLLGYTLTGPGTAVLPFAETPPNSSFSVSNPAVGSLNGLSYSGTSLVFVGTNTIAAATDSSTVDDVVFTYTSGTSYKPGIGGDDTLILYSSLGNPTSGTGVGIDNSGNSSGLFGTSGSVLIPSAVGVPSPASLAGGIVLMLTLGGIRALSSRMTV
jgi:hypothetical protein